jgi:hypothetical protein
MALLWFAMPGRRFERSLAHFRGVGDSVAATDFPVPPACPDENGATQFGATYRAGPSEESELRRRLIGPHTNKTLAEVEDELGLGRPIEVLEPEFPDPMQWRRYRVHGRFIVDLAAAADPEAPPEHDSSDGRFQLATGVWAVSTVQSDLRGHRHGTHCLPSWLSGHEEDIPARYPDYFQALDPTRRVSVAQIERELGLPEETWQNVGASIFPLHWFHYDVGDCFVGFGGVYDRSIESRPPPGPDESPEERRRWKEGVIFAGYWRAGPRCEDE